MRPDDELEPKKPQEAGITKESPPATQIEGARLLASEAFDRLAERGFSYTQVDEWAQTYVAEEGSGDVDRFIAWIETQEET